MRDRCSEGPPRAAVCTFARGGLRGADFPDALNPAPIFSHGGRGGKRVARSKDAQSSEIVEDDAYWWRAQKFDRLLHSSFPPPKPVHHEVSYTIDLSDNAHLRKGLPRHEIRLSVPKFFLFVVSLPLFAFVFCVIWSLVFHFRAVTSTHCRVPNYLPSISAAIGTYWPQHFVWRSAIALHFPGRMLALSYYWKWYSKVLRSECMPLSRFTCALHVVENVCLVGLSFFNSAYSFVIHRNFFCSFILCSELYMFASLWLNENGRRFPPKGNEFKAMKWKKRLAAVNLIACALCAYCYYRHNTNCEPFMYTWFCLFEYVVVLSNMAFHITACMDFHDKFINVPVPFQGITRNLRQLLKKLYHLKYSYMSNRQSLKVI